MTCHAIFREEDIFHNKHRLDTEIIYAERVTGKAVVFDSEGNVALVGNKINSYYLLPGGGIHSDESIHDGIIRECLEEIGCNVNLIDDLGITEDFRARDKKHCINHCFTAQVIGKKRSPRLTKEEAKNGVHVKWVSLEDAIKILKTEVRQLSRGEVEFYNTGFNILRDNIFLLEAKKIINK